MDPMLPEGMQDHRLIINPMDAINENDTSTFPVDMKFGNGHLLSIIGYSILMILGGTGNIIVLTWLVRRHTKTRIDYMLIQLAIADLLVIFIMMPLELIWQATVYWRASDAVCRIMAFFRVFGLYLSSFILICISVDRYYAILKPLRLSGVDSRGRTLITIAWVASFICSVPQTIMFHVDTHPKVRWYTQCVVRSFNQNAFQEVAYSFVSMLLMYAIPLIAIIFCYASIIIEIQRRSRDTTENKMRRSSMAFFDRARSRTLKMTITIVLVFFVCWTPFYVMCLWYWLDRSSAEKQNHVLQRALFQFACANSCMNPLVYGIYNIPSRAQKSVQRPSSGKINQSQMSETVELHTPRIENSKHI